MDPKAERLLNHLVKIHDGLNFALADCIHGHFESLLSHLERVELEIRCTKQELEG